MSGAVPPGAGAPGGDPAARLVALRGAFTERHLPLYALLGLRARLDRVAALLPDPAPAPAPEAAAAPAPGDLTDLDLALLGIVALRARLHAALPEPAAPAPAPVVPDDLGDLLR